MISDTRHASSLGGRRRGLPARLSRARRASIINFLNKMVDEGVLNSVEESARGGFRRVYSARLDEWGFVKELVMSIISSLMRDFPDETREVINSYL